MGACNEVQPKVVDKGPSVNGGCGCMYDSCLVFLFCFIVFYLFILGRVNMRKT